ncbi:uncharacterized protein LOC120328634 [Styela clava]
MTSLLQENRLRLQQRISQRLRGDVKSFITRDIVPQRYIPRRRRRPEEHLHTDPFRFQAQDLYRDGVLNEKWARPDSNQDHGDSIQLPIFKPRYTEMHTHKGVPSQKYVDVILDRKGPMHRLPSRYFGIASGIPKNKKYDDSLTIRSYRHTEDSYQDLVSVDKGDFADEPPYGRIVLIAPHKIQYAPQDSKRIYNIDNTSSVIKHRMEQKNMAALKGTKLSSSLYASTDNFEEAKQHVSRRNAELLRKIGKRLSASDRKFIGEITSQQSLFQKQKTIRTREAPPLPPIRITVTNPLPVPSPELESSPKQEAKQDDSTVSNENMKNMPLLKLSHTVKKKHKKKNKNAPKNDEKSKMLEENLSENTQSNKPEISETTKERKQSDSGHLMPAPITKITFQSYNAENLKKPKKSTNNVQVDRIVQDNIVAIHPRAVPRYDAPSVRISNFEMSENPRPDMIFRKDGTVGPAPPSTNYVHFQKTTRLGGQSRVLLSLKNRHFSNDREEILRSLKTGEEQLAIHSNASDLGDFHQPTGHHEGMVYRKLGRIKAMKRSLMAAHNAIMAGSDAGKIEIDTVTDEGRSERSFDSDQRPLKAAKSYYVNRLPDSYPSNTLQPPITGFYMGRSSDSNQHQISEKTRTMATQWSSNTSLDGESHITPLVPPNTAMLENMRRYQN